MGLTPSTGSALSFGRVYKAYTNVAVNTPGNAVTTPGPYTGSQNIKLSQILGPFEGKTVGVSIKFSETFGGKSTPYDY